MARISLTILLCLVCIACQTHVVPPTATHVPTETPVPPTPIPPVRITSYQLVQGPDPGEWRVLGQVKNVGEEILGSITLNVELVNDFDEVVAKASVGALMSNLMPGEAGPFLAAFDGVATPHSARVELVDHASAEGERGDLAAEMEVFFLTGDGELAALGYVANFGLRPVELGALGFLGQGPNGSERLVAVMQFGPTRLAASERVPILLIAPENPGEIAWTLFHDGVETDTRVTHPLQVQEEPKLHLTAQGAPFVAGTLINAGSFPAAGSVLVSIVEGGRVIGLSELEVPRHLQAGEPLAFAAFDFPGIHLRFDPETADTMQVDLRVEGLELDRSINPIALPVDVSAFHSVGSAIFIRGTVQNPTDDKLASATVHAEVRSSKGDLVTAGWSTVGALDAGESLEFVLDLPIPTGMDATQTEYDLRAIGLPAD